MADPLGTVSSWFLTWCRHSSGVVPGSSDGGGLHTCCAVLACVCGCAGGVCIGMYVSWCMCVCMYGGFTLAALYLVVCAAVLLACASVCMHVEVSMCVCVCVCV